MKKTSILIMGLVVVVILLIAGFLVYQNYYNKPQVQNLTQQTQNVKQASDKNQGIQCGLYTNFSDVVSYLKNSSAAVPILLPTQLPKSYTIPEIGKLSVSYGAGDAGGYSVLMSLNGDSCNPGSVGDANFMGMFMASNDAIGKPLDFEQGEKISLAKGLQGYYFETGRNPDANINWVYNGVYYQVIDLHMTKTEAIATVNSAINNAK